MTLQKINTRNTVLILMIVIAAAFRLVTYKLSLRYPFEMSNFNTIGAMALFGGAYFTDKVKAYLIPFLALFLSDVALHYAFGVNWNSFIVYFCFAIMVFIGSLIKKATVVNVLAASIVSVAIHWLLTDLPWLYGAYYPHTLAGYGQSLVAAIPFERNMLIADAIFCAVLFGGFELAKSKYTVLRTNREVVI
jgi:hypothetical protein